MGRFYKDLTGKKSSDALLSKEQWNNNNKTRRKIDFRDDILCHFS
jgi:hypothetical protein